MADNMNDRVGHGGDPLKLEASDASNPWMVDNVSVFLNYCCPECDFKAKTLKLFSNHALENHEEALVLFEDELSDIEAKYDNSDTYKDQKDSNTENEDIGIDLKSQEKQTDQVSDKSGMPGESRVLLEKSIMSTYKEDQMESNTENEEIGLRIDLKSHEKQTDHVSDKSHDIYFLINQSVSGMPGESRVLLENRMMSTSSKKQITNINRACCVKTCMSTNLDKLKKNFFSIPSPNRYRHSICIRTVRCELALVHLISSWLNCAEIECTVHFALAKQHIKMFKQVQ